MISRIDVPRGTPYTVPGKSRGSCTDQSSSWRSGGNSRAGSPAAIQPMGTTVPGSRTEFTCSTLLILSSLPRPATDPGNIDTPVATTITSATGDFTAATATWAPGESGDKVVAVTATDDQLVEATVENLALMTVLNHQAVADPELRALWSQIQGEAVHRTAVYVGQHAKSGRVHPVADPEALGLMGAGMNDRYAPLVVAGETTVAAAVEEMHRIWMACLGR